MGRKAKGGGSSGGRPRRDAAPPAAAPAGARPAPARDWRPMALAGAVLVALLLGALLWRGVVARQPEGAPATAAAPATASPAADDLSAVQTFDYVGNQHTSGPDVHVDYAEVPPVGGEHAPPPYWLNCGIYDKPVSNESAVHSLEHGAVWITYRPDLPQADVEKLRDVVRSERELLTSPLEVRGEGYMILSPYPDLPAPVVVSAWNKQLRLTGADDPRLEEFIRTYRLADTAPEPGASCSGGVGDPLKN